MLYDIRLVIDYSYAAPSDHTRNLLRLLPFDIEGRQRVIVRHLNVDPAPDERRDMLDFFGNATTAVAWHAPIDSVSLQLAARVELRAPGPQGLDLSPPLEHLPAEIAAQQSLAPGAPHHFLGASPRVMPLPEITAFARDTLTPGMTALQAVEAIGRRLHREMEFDAEATTVDTSPAEAFVKRRGVCQDFTQIMIAALRGIGIPAGYVSGFLRTFPPPGQPRLEGADAMHAWVRAWVGRDIGWVEFDPTNDQQAGLDYVVVAYGRDYSDVAPVRGVMRSAGGHDSRQAVDVIPLDPA
ncbi:transglutaminase family protein [Paenirhodobacter sp.]|uniref:transglutaminase family protein n=1 Tax=Paenirhodobacter sp. TaxID=1965326 RepID=UPI003B40A716